MISHLIDSLERLERRASLAGQAPSNVVPFREFIERRIRHAVAYRYSLAAEAPDGHGWLKYQTDRQCDLLIFPASRAALFAHHAAQDADSVSSIYPG